MSRPMVTAITVSYNSAKTIRDTIESVLNQTYDKMEYIIVDGLSKDDTVKIAEEYKEKFAAKGYLYKIISEKDNGIYDAMNKGIKNATGDLIGIINSDDWYEKEAAETAAAEYEKKPYVMFYADINIVRADGSVIVKHSKNMKGLQTSLHWNHPTTFIPKKVYDKVGLYACDNINDDWDMYLRIKKTGKRFVVVNKVLANFRFGGVSNDHGFKKWKQRINNCYVCYRKNGYSRLYWFVVAAKETAKILV